MALAHNNSVDALLPVDDDTLISMIRAGGSARDQAWGHIYDRNVRWMKGFLINRGCNISDVDDLIQQTFINADRGIRNFQRRSKLDTWIRSIAENVLKGQYRRSKLVNEEELTEEISNSVASNDDDHRDKLDFQRCVAQGMAKFAREDDPDRAFVIEKFSLDGWTYRDVAQMLGKKESAAKDYAFRARARLMPYIERCMEFIRGQ